MHPPWGKPRNTLGRLRLRSEILTSAPRARPLRAPNRRPLSVDTIHLINPMRDTAGSEWRTFELYRLLSPHAPTRIWSSGQPAHVFRDQLPINRLRPGLLRQPFGGTLVFVGIYARIGWWIRLARPRRIILLYNTPTSETYWQAVRLLRPRCRRPLEVVYASTWLRDSVGGTGPVQVSPIDLERFQVAPATGPAERPFTVGRHSRDIAYKHHPDDPALYRRLLESGVRLRILGGTVLAPQLPAGPGLDLLPVNTESPAAFLRSLDCFFYRTSPRFREPHGRVVQEAMACGLPVVCDRHGGYADYIEHGRNGFLFDTDDEAFDLLSTLRRDPDLRQRLGQAGRATVEHLFSPESCRAVVDFYLDRPTKETATPAERATPPPLVGA